MDVNTYTYWVLQGKKHRHQQVLGTIAAPPAPRQLSVEVHDHGRETLLLKLLFFWRPPGVPNIELGDSWARITPENHVLVGVFFEEPGIICFHWKILYDWGSPLLPIFQCWPGHQKVVTIWLTPVSWGCRIPSECRRRQVKLDGGAEWMFVLEDVRVNPKFGN